MGILPTAPHTPKTSMSAYAWLVYGPPKIGKTTFANGWPKSLFLATEPGTAAMTASDVAINSWTDFENVLKALESEPNEYRSLIVDTVDNLWEFLVDAICTENGWQDLGDGGYGKGYKLARRKFTAAIARLRGLRRAVLFISHERRETDEKTKFVTITSQLPGSARKVLHGSVDFILRAELSEDDERVLRTQPHADKQHEIECGSRGVPERPMADLIPLTFNDLHAAFRAAFPNTAEKAKE